jgi:hypothetical protein
VIKNSSSLTWPDDVNILCGAIMIQRSSFMQEVTIAFSPQRVTALLLETRVAVLEREPLQWFSNLAISPDGRWILYTQLDQGGNDIMLVENFH